MSMARTGHTSMQTPQEWHWRLISLFVGLFVGRRLERRDRSRQDDKTRINEPLYAELQKLISSEDSAKKGFLLNTPDTQVLDGIVDNGLLVPSRHRWLKEDVEKLRILTLSYRNRSFDFNVAANHALETQARKANLDDVKSDTALYNAVAGLGQEAFVSRYKEILLGRHIVEDPKSSYGEQAFYSITAVVKGARDLLREATADLLAHGSAMKLALESALVHGKYRSAPVRCSD